MLYRQILLGQLLAAIALSACATSPSDAAAQSTPATFAEFVSAAEKAAANRQESFVIPSEPTRGSDYAASPGRVAKGAFVSYNFLDSPCITPSTAETAITGAGYVKQKRSSDPHGARAHEVPDANRYAVQESYVQAGDDKRSLNLDYSVASGQECVSSLFVDFPE